MYSRIVIPLDGSQLSESILPCARSLLKGLKIPVELLHVIDPEVISVFVNPAHGRNLEAVEADMKRKGLEYLDPIASSLPEPGVVTCSAEIGRPAEVIVKRASADPASLIAMATHGRSGLRRWLLGSVAHRVLLSAANPLLLARPAESLEATGVTPLKTIVVPLDGSALAEKALPHAEGLARRMNLEIILIRAYALPPVAYYATEGYMPNLDALMAEVKESAQQYLDETLERLKSEGLSRVSTLLVEGDAAGNIIDIAKRTPASLVALCTHGRSGFSRLVLGSVADRVVRESGDPILMIRSQPQKE
jgi:nucleotide-binding universal stress UspA family protein